MTYIYIGSFVIITFSNCTPLIFRDGHQFFMGKTILVVINQLLDAQLSFCSNDKKFKKIQKNTSSPPKRLHGV
jgi:hypothetical protein